ncbi:unnamed protein product [Rodentolepis nana]|uniref:Secreted protein n=1 Tax=Rodentolepis nana TaxID=102285 RepID=A0A0R3TIA4_RODNA|nr:unnamed protein product [Rodentolepis nana]
MRAFWVLASLGLYAQWYLGHGAYISSKDALSLLSKSLNDERLANFVLHSHRFMGTTKIAKKPLEGGYLDAVPAGLLL